MAPKVIPSISLQIESSIIENDITKGSFIAVD